MSKAEIIHLCFIPSITLPPGYSLETCAAGFRVRRADSGGYVGRQRVYHSYDQAISAAMRSARQVAYWQIVEAA